MHGLCVCACVCAWMHDAYAMWSHCSFATPHLYMAFLKIMLSPLVDTPAAVQSFFQHQVLQPVLSVQSSLSSPSFSTRRACVGVRERGGLGYAIRPGRPTAGVHDDSTRTSLSPVSPRLPSSVHTSISISCLVSYFLSSISCCFLSHLIFLVSFCSGESARGHVFVDRVLGQVTRQVRRPRGRMTTRYFVSDLSLV